MKKKLCARVYLCGLVLCATAGGACTTASSGVPAQLAAQPTPAVQQIERAASPRERLIAGAVEQTTYTFSYDPAYVSLAYPNGDVPPERGVCADVIVRALRRAGVDPQKELHEDMTRHFAKYPNKWGARRPDPNIDHRRVANLMVWLERRGKALPVSAQAADYQPGDVVAWELATGQLHIGLVSDQRAEGGERFAIVHNINSGAKLEDVLFAWQVIGHYRYFTHETHEEKKHHPEAARVRPRHHGQRIKD